MIDNVTYKHRYKKPEYYRVGSCGTHNFPQGKWKVKKAWRSIDKTVYQDLRRFPWKGLQQAQRPFGLFQARALGVLGDVRKDPPSDRMRLPASGNYPVVRGIESGAPNPWVEETDACSVGRRAAMDQSHASYILGQPSNLLPPVPFPSGVPPPTGVQPSGSGAHIDSMRSPSSGMQFETGPGTRHDVGHTNPLHHSDEDNEGSVHYPSVSGSEPGSVHYPSPYDTGVSVTPRASTTPSDAGSLAPRASVVSDANSEESSAPVGWLRSWFGFGGR